MNVKIIGTFVCMLMVLTIVFPIAALPDINNSRTTPFDADTPIWEVGDEWTYHFIDSETVDPVYSFSGDITLKVAEDLGDSYILEGATNAQGKIDMGNFGLKTTRFTSYSLTLQIRKVDLALEKFREKIKGFFLLTVGPVALPVPLQVGGQKYVEFDPPWVIMPFPLFDGKSGTLNSTEILHINIYFHLFWGLVPALGPFNSSMPFIPVPYNCSEEQITVQGSTFDVYNVSAEYMDGCRFVSYYAKDVGNVAKEEIFIPRGGGRVYYSLKLELKDWSYTS